jgi:cytochrome c oxidase cbb3-type subunit 2
MSLTEKHKKLERNVTLLGVAALVTVAIGGIV